MASRIALLDDNTASRIAAGEVVERPASAVKELVENAVDAEATVITVSLTEGGKRRITVADNGCGMSAEDAVLAIQRHATSKIRSADDLFSIRTLGFRGEALPSIASVCHLSLTSYDHSEAAGVRLVVHGGDIETVEECAARAGTVVDIQDLFYNTPARLKFMKSTHTEVARCVDAVAQLAIAHPEISFRVLSNDQEILSTPGGGDPLNAIAATWGREVARKMIPVDGGDDCIRVTGFVASPDVNRPGRSHELFLVNLRPIRSRLLNHALEEGVRSMTPESRYPVAAVAISLAPDLVDVNVHPTKTEVKFTRDGDVHHAVSSALKRSLIGHGVMPSVSLPDGGQSAPQEMPTQHALEGSDDWRRSSPGLTWLAPVQASTPDDPALAAPVDAGTTPTVEGALPFSVQLRGFRVLGQVRRTYIVAATEDGVAFVDQHVAHERVLYERLTTLRHEKGIPSQMLAVPISISFGGAEAGMLAQRLPDFAAAGWGIEAFGRDSFLVRAVPSLVSPGNCEAVLRDMVDELAHLSVARRLIVQRDQVTITNACKMAVKAGDHLNMPEMVGLLEQLAQTENPSLCPHGRPAVVVLPYGDIDRRFKR